MEEFLFEAWWIKIEFLPSGNYKVLRGIPESYKEAKLKISPNLQAAVVLDKKKIF